MNQIPIQEAGAFPWQEAEMTKEQRAHDRDTYRAYLLRLWQDRPSTPWRALVRDAEDSEEHRFATIEQLFLFLHGQTEGNIGGRERTRDEATHEVETSDREFPES